MHTNLGNLFSHCGRVIDAVREWDEALRIDPTFGMALGNRGYGLMEYGALLHTWHQVLFFRAAHADLTSALAPDAAIHPEAREGFERALSWLEAGVPSDVLRAHPHEHFLPSGMDEQERAYRTWVLAHRLFLNDLNDLGEDPIAATDAATLPGLVTPIGTGFPHAIGFFDQMKQEYTSARYFYYEGVTAAEAHFADSGVDMANTYDYPAYGISLERVKVAFRMAYSLLDKVAYFLNDYLALGIAENRVAFRSLWYEKEEPRRGLRADLAQLENAPLKGLFWIAKDLFVRDPGFVGAMEPDARELAAVRNHLEHKYLKVHLFGAPPPGAGPTTFEAVAFSVDRGEFERRTLRLLQLARAALLHLALVVHVEEGRRRDGKDESRVFTREMDTYDDDWKV
jgi:hypothetical protein